MSYLCKLTNTGIQLGLLPLIVQLHQRSIKLAKIHNLLLSAVGDNTWQFSADHIGQFSVNNIWQFGTDKRWQFAADITWSITADNTRHNITVHWWDTGQTVCCWHHVTVRWWPSTKDIHWTTRHFSLLFVSPTHWVTIRWVPVNFVIKI